MEIFRHVYQIASLVADRNLFQYLFVGDNTVLLDTGASYTPSETISPFLKQVGIAPSRLTIAINTHADADHHGGNASLKQIAGQVMLACGEPDRLMIEDPDRLFASRYNQWIPEHGVGLGLHADASAWVRKMVGDPQRIDQTFVGGEDIRVDDERSLQVLHVPGHSDGHLALYDRGNKAVFVGAALHGRYCHTGAHYKCCTRLILTGSTPAIGRHTTVRKCQNFWPSPAASLTMLRLLFGRPSKSIPKVLRCKASWMNVGQL